MKTHARKSVLALFAAAVALSTAAATPALAMGDGAGWRYDRYLEREAETIRSTSASSLEQRSGDRQLAIGNTVFSDVGSGAGKTHLGSKDPSLSDDINYLDHTQHQSGR